MVNRKFNGVDIGDSAVAFFEKLGVLESTKEYTLGIKNPDAKYIGKYQLGTDALIDMGWLAKGSTWGNAKFIGEAATKWKLTNKRSFLNNPAAQDEAMMKSMVLRWKVVKKHTNKICSKINVPTDTKYLCFERTTVTKKIKGKKVKLPIEGKNGELYKILKSKKSQGYKSEDLRGKSIVLTSSGLLAASHLCGQNAMDDALKNNFKGRYGIPVDGNAVPSLFYHENLAGYDLSVIIGYKDNCEIGHKVVEKNHTQTDNKNINKQAVVNGNSKNNIQKPAQQKVQQPNSVTKDAKNEVVKDIKSGVFEFNGQKFEEVWDSEEYRRDRAENGKAPELAFVNPEEAILKRLQAKFQDENVYNKDYVKYLETKTGKKVLEENKEDINVILKMYDEATKDNDKIGNVIRQHGFDILRGREETDEILRIQDIVYYIYSYPIPNKSSIESLEHVLGQYSAKYVKYPDKKPVNKFKKHKDYVDKIQGVIQIHVKDEEVKIEKNQLPESYDKYMQGIKDIDEIVIKVAKKQSSELQKTRCENLIRELGNNSLEYEKTYSADENGVRQFPLSRRLIDNIIIEFLKVQTGFKEENETRYFDNHKYRDSNIVRNYLLWYIQKHKGIDIPSKSEMGLFGRLEKIGKEIRVTTVLKDWISSKSAIKVRNIRKISNLIDEVYGNYRDNLDFEKDKSIILALFKNSKELRDYAANIDSMDLYSFYKSFYELQNIIDPTGELFVNDKCMLKCTLGDDISRLIIKEDSVTVGGGKQANINDTNIQPFKLCRAIGICKPELLAMWEKNTDVKVRNHPALLDISTIQCIHGGTVSIDDAGQKEIGTAVTKTKEVREAVRDADCQYKLLINICSDINNNFMQTQLKKEAQKFAKWKKYKKNVTDKMASYFAKDVKNMLGMQKLSESEKRDYDNFVKANKAKMQIAEKEISEEKEKNLRNRIFMTFKEAYKKVKQTSAPKFDTKGVIKNHGLSLCDYERKNFYSAKMLPVIAYGYLMQAANLKINQIEKKLMLAELNSDINSTNTNKINLEKFSIQNMMKPTRETKVSEIKSSDILTWMGIGYNLYSQTQSVPTGKNILDWIRKNGKSVAVCPFSKGEWGEIHESSKNLDVNRSSVRSNVQKIKIDNSLQTQSKVQSVKSNQNIVEKTQSNEGCKTNNCPHVGVQGYYILNVRRIEETKLSTLSEFSILDPSGKKVAGYGGYIIEREGPDTVEMLKKKRIIAGTHELRWHYRGEPRNYWAIGVFNHQQDNRGKFHRGLEKKVLIHEERWILIHPGTSRGSSVGCLIIAKNYYKDGLLHRCDKEESEKFMKKLIKYTIQIEGKKIKNHEMLKKFKLKISNEFKK